MSLLSSASRKKRLQPSAENGLLSNFEGKQEKPLGKRSKKRLHQEALELAEEERLEALLFGKKHLIPKKREKAFLIENIHDDGGAVEREPDALFEIDRSGDTTKVAGDEVVKVAASTDSTPAWVDFADEKEDIQVDLLQTSRLRKLRHFRDETDPLPVAEFESRLRDRFQETAQVAARTDWARLSDKQTTLTLLQEDVEDDANVLSTSAPLLLHGSSKSSSLPPHTISLVRCSDANAAEINRSVVQSVHFHPTSNPDQPLLLTAGLDKMLRFFQVGQEYSEKIHGINFPKLPIYSASFLGSTGNVVVSGRRPFFYIYDAVAGRMDLVPRILGRQEKSLEKLTVSPDGSLIAFYGNDGYVILVDVRTKQWLADLKINGSVRAIAFSPNGKFLYASGSDGQVYQWDVASRRCIDRFDNQDGTITSALACSSQHLAVGAESGVVNFYHAQNQAILDKDDSGLLGNRKPIKAIMNLQTSADLVKFSTEGQILAISSRREREALKLLHVPTRTVFSNWPTSKTPLGYVWSLDFSPKSMFMAIGNDKGKCLLYRLSHFDGSQ